MTEEDKLFEEIDPDNPDYRKPGLKEPVQDDNGNWIEKEKYYKKKQGKLKDVHAVVRKWLHLKDMNRVDLILAVALSRMLKGTKLWLIIIGGSGGTKSELLKPLDDDEVTTYVLQELTPNTLVSGNNYAEDLALKIKDKIILIYDMAILLNLRKDDKAKVWAQLRELYDGNCSKDVGSGKKGTKYKDLNVTLIACSTGAIDNQILIHNTLGTREMLYRIKPTVEIDEEEALMNKVLENDEKEEQMRKELREVFDKFFSYRKPKNITLPKEVLAVIKNYVKYVIVLRTSAALDSYTGDLLSTAETEYPTRILKQYKRTYQCLKSLDDNYTDEKALGIIREVRDSSCNQDRIEILKFLVKNAPEKLPFWKIGQALRLGNSTIKRHLATLWNLKLVERVVDGESPREVYYWYANVKHHVVEMIKKELGMEVKEEKVS